MPNKRLCRLPGSLAVLCTFAGVFLLLHGSLTCEEPDSVTSPVRELNKATEDPEKSSPSSQSETSSKAILSTDEVTVQNQSEHAGKTQEDTLTQEKTNSATPNKPVSEPDKADRQPAVPKEKTADNPAADGNTVNTMAPANENVPAATNKNPKKPNTDSGSVPGNTGSSSATPDNTTDPALSQTQTANHGSQNQTGADTPASPGTDENAKENAESAAAFDFSSLPFSSASDGATYYAGNNAFVRAGTRYEPQPGDVVFFSAALLNSVSQEQTYGVLLSAEGDTLQVLPVPDAGTNKTEPVQIASSKVSGFGSAAMLKAENEKEKNGKQQMESITLQELIWQYLLDDGYTQVGAAAIMGNWQVESHNNPGTVQLGFGYTSEEYTKQIENGSYSRDKFASDAIGYGLAQWTSAGRKKKMYDFCTAENIADLSSQLRFFSKEMSSRQYSDLKAYLQSEKECRSVSEAATRFHDEYERSADLDLTRRIEYSLQIFKDRCTAQ